MKIQEITIEHRGRGVHIYKLDETIVTVGGSDGTIGGYPIDGKFFDMACSVNSAQDLRLDLDGLDVLSEILASVAEGDLTS